MDDHEHAELLALYEQATEDIRTFQGRQAAVTQLAVAVDAGLIAYWQLVSGSAAGCLRVLALLGGVAGLVWLTFLQSAIHSARTKVTDAEDLFSRAVFWKARASRNPRGWLEAKDIYLLFVVVVVVAAVLTWVAISDTGGV
jgi:hypothetical protein